MLRLRRLETESYLGSLLLPDKLGAAHARETEKSVLKFVEQAVAEAGLAYQFNAGSYTFGALAACLAARDALVAPSWVDEYLDYAALAVQP